MENKQFRLPKPFAEKWIAALRSGEYKQAKGYTAIKINGEKCYCVLGVAGVVAELSFDKLKNEASLLKFAGKGTPIPIELLSPSYVLTSLPGETSSMNDEGFTFSQIADWIEQNVDFYETTK